jgi:hypothetical protein
MCDLSATERFSIKYDYMGDNLIYNPNESLTCHSWASRAMVLYRLETDRQAGRQLQLPTGPCNRSLPPIGRHCHVWPGLPEQLTGWLVAAAGTNTQ